MTSDDKMLDIRYNRFAEDWRFHHNLIWQIPPIAISIMGSILTVSYNFLGVLPRAILLGIGSVLIFALTIALAKHRLGADARTQFLYELDPESKTRFPLISKDIREYLEGREKLTDDILFRMLINRRSEIWLSYVMFSAFILLSILTIMTVYEVIKISDVTTESIYSML